MSLIEKKINNISNILYASFIKQKTFIQLCKNIMKNIVKNEMKEEISFDSLNNKKEIFYELVNKETIKKQFYIIYEEENEYNEKKEDIIKLFNEKDIISINSRINSIYERKNDIYKIIIFIVNANYFDNDDNYIEFRKLINNYQINKLNPIIFFIKDEKEKERLNDFKRIFKLKFEYVYNLDELQEIINNIKSNNDKNDLYQKYNELILGERFYKFLIEKYLILFNKSIFGSKKQNYEKYELLFLKISQDIQFLQKFNFDNTISLKEQTKNDIIDIIKNKDILKLIDEFIAEKKILTDIDSTLSEFEETIDEQMKNENKTKNNDLNENNDKTNGKNGESNYKSKIEINKENNNFNNDNKNEIIQDNNINSENKTIKDNNNINDENKNEIIKNNNIINKNKNKMIQDNNINIKIKNDNIQEKDSCEIKEEKTENLNKNNDNNSSDKNSALLKEIKICEDILTDKNPRQRKKIKQGKTYQFFVFKNLIRENLEEKIKNEILNIVYVILQQSIIHQFEKKFLEEYMNKICE